MKKALILGLVTILLLEVAFAVYPTFPTANIEDWLMDRYDPQNVQTIKYSPEYTAPYKTATQNFTQVTAPSHNIITGDFDTDGEFEVIFTSGDSLIIRDKDWAVKDSIASAGDGYITIIPQSCNAGTHTGDYTIFLVEKFGVYEVKSYCWNGTDIGLIDTNTINLRPTFDDAPTCEYSSTTGFYECFLADLDGYQVCHIDSADITCNAHANTKIGGYPYPLKPAVKNIDGSSDLEAVFYCNLSGNVSQQGFMIVDELGNTDRDNCTGMRAEADAEVSHHPTILTENNYILIHQVDSISAVEGHFWYTGVDSIGDYKYDIEVRTGFESNVRTGSQTNPVEYDPNGDSYYDLVCYASATWGVISGFLDCFDISTGNYDGAYSGENIISGSSTHPAQLISVELDSNQLGAEFIAVNNNLATYSYHNASVGGPGTKVSTNSINTSISWKENMIITNLFDNNAEPHLLFYDSSGVQYYTPQTSIPEVANSIPTFTLHQVIPPENVTNTNNSFILNMTANDANSDLMTMCVISDYLVGDEIGLDLTDLTPNCHYNITNGEAKEFIFYTINTTIGIHYKVFVGDPTEQDLDDLNSVEGNLIYENHSQVDYLCVWAQERGTSNSVEDMTVAVTNYYRSGEERIYGTTNSDGKIWFRVPQGQYNVSWYDTRGQSPSYYNDTTTCASYNDPITCLCYLDLDTTISDETSMSFIVRDSSTLNTIFNTNITLVSPETDFAVTGAGGQASFTGLNESVYEVRFNADTYDQYISYFAVQDTIHTVYLTPASATETYIALTVKDSTTLLPIEQAFVSFYNPITYEIHYEFTSSEGEITQPVSNGDYHWEIDVTKVGYADYGTQLWVNSEITNTYTIYVAPSGTEAGGLVNHTTGRGCQDLLRGIWLCNQTNIHCEQNSDCLSDMCNVAGQCSSFNYTWCDNNGRPRNQRCIMAGTFERFIGNITDWILDNFLWVLIIILLLMGVTTMVIVFRHKK